MKKLKCFFYVLLICCYFFSLQSIFSQEALKSIEEDYYDFLSLQGELKRPTLNYRTLSDNKWTVNESENHLWKQNNLGTTFSFWQPENPSKNGFIKGIRQGVFFRVYGPEWFNSYNTAAPYGQNDGALWQGKGYNTSFTTGFRLETYGFEFTVKPQISFSQNLDFEYITPNYKSVDSSGNPTIYDGKASKYGYYGINYIDAPQRFGDSSIFTFSWGDTEIRYTWKNFTLGFGTQSIWLGPAKLNPIIHSNNAASYPKIDIGLRRQQIVLPWLDWYCGDLELRGWWGKLSESDFFDNDETNNHNLISGLSAAWSLPGIFDGLSVGINRTMISKWNNINSYTLFEIFFPSIGTSGGEDASDQRFSFVVDYLMPKADFEIYLEWARNDYSPSMDFIIRYPFHTQGWTFGSQKAFDLPNSLKLQLLLELTFLECSADYDRLLSWHSTFYAHHKVTQGYTNQGQWLGAGIGTGGNSQYFGIKLFHKKGNIVFFVQRRNPDLDYTMFIDSKKYSENTWIAESNIRAILDFGISGNYFINNNLSLFGKYVYEDERNPFYISNKDRSSIHRKNNHISLGMKYNF